MKQAVKAEFCAKSNGTKSPFWFTAVHWICIESISCVAHKEQKKKEEERNEMVKIMAQNMHVEIEKYPSKLLHFYNFSANTNWRRSELHPFALPPPILFRWHNSLALSP